MQITGNGTEGVEAHKIIKNGDGSGSLKRVIYTAQWCAKVRTLRHLRVDLKIGAVGRHAVRRAPAVTFLHIWHHNRLEIQVKSLHKCVVSTLRHVGC